MELLRERRLRRVAEQARLPKVEDLRVLNPVEVGHDRVAEPDVDLHLHGHAAEVGGEHDAHADVGRISCDLFASDGARVESGGRNLILSGRPGLGKTHLAVAIGYRAIQNGFTARFVGTSALIDELGEASRAGCLREAAAEWVAPDVLIVDEVGYLAPAADAANVLFGVVDQRYLHQKPLILTTHKRLRSWGEVLHDHDLAAVILDLLMTRAVVGEAGLADTRFVGAVPICGRAEPVAILECFEGDLPHQRAGKLATTSDLDAAVEARAARRWLHAVGSLKDILEQNPDDTVARWMLSDTVAQVHRP